MQVQHRRLSGDAARIPQSKRMSRHLGSMESGTQKWTRGKRKQKSWLRDSHGGYYLLSTYQVSDSGISALPITLFQPPFARQMLISHFTNKEQVTLSPTAKQYRTREATPGLPESNINTFLYCSSIRSKKNTSNSVETDIKGRLWTRVYNLGSTE